MKPLVIVTLLLLLSSKIFAQQDDKTFYIEKSEKYRRMRNTGQVLTVTGGLVFIIGVVTLSNSSIDTNSNGYSSTTTTVGNPAQGAAEVFVGFAALGAGIPLWIVGGHSHRKYEHKLQMLTLQPYTLPQQRGLTLCYRF